MSSWDKKNSWAGKEISIVVLLLNDRRWLSDSLSQDMSLEEVRKPRIDFVVEEFPRRHHEDLCLKHQHKARQIEQNLTYGLFLLELVAWSL